ncbi:transporter, partial [Lactococcus lactis]
FNCMSYQLQKYRKYYLQMQLLNPLISMLGFCLPLTVHNGENILWMVLLGLIIAFVGSIFYIFAIGKTYN